MTNKLNLNLSMVQEARGYARKIAEDTSNFIQKHTTTTIERTCARLLGIDGIDSNGVPLPNIVVESIQNQGGLSLGLSTYLGNAVIQTGRNPQQIAEEIVSGELDITELKMAEPFEIRDLVMKIANQTLDWIILNRNRREQYLNNYKPKEGPFLYTIVATGNIYEDITQARAAATQGADVIAVIRTTAQSLLDYVPFGATTEGFGGTYATQENFRLMRRALDEVSEQQERYIMLCNYCSGLCMPEIAAMGALERLDMMLNDALYGILFRDINMKRTLIDQYFSRIINGFAGVIINTGEDNYLTTSDAFEEAHTVLASQFINEQFALLSGVPKQQIGLGHAFEMAPDLENSFLFELAQAQMAREIFPEAPLKYMPPTKFKTGNIFKAHVQDTLFNMISVMTDQKIHLLGMLTEAIHTPLMSDRALSIENASYVFKAMKDFINEVEYKPDGIISNRANQVLGEACEMLKAIHQEGLFNTLEQGKFAGVKRPVDGGKGLGGVVEKSPEYFNPFIELMLERGNLNE